MKKFLTFLAASLCAFSISAAPLRDYVCIVRGNFSTESKEFLEDFSKKLNNSGYTLLSKKIDTYLKGTFGSGFVYYASNGKPYVITNRHVVENYDTVNVTFENDDGSESDYKELKIFATDEDLDLAMIELPEGFKKSGLSFVNSKIQDGQDVFSAGFPGLGGEPSWQLGKGIVSNSIAKVKALINPDVTTLIQHTAEVDGGNSGGPLLIASSSQDSGYAVAGINTWKAYARQSANFAIPAAIVKTTIEKYATGKNTETTVKDRLEAFKKMLAEEKIDLSDASHFISTEMVNKCGKDSFIRVLRNGSAEAVKIVCDVFDSDPVASLRYSLSYEVVSSFLDKKDESKKKEYTAAIEETEDKTTVTFTIEKKEVASTWIQDKGNWKIRTFGSINESVSGSSNSFAVSGEFDGFHTNELYLLQVQAGPGFDVSNFGNVGFNASLFCNSSNHFGIGISVLGFTATATKDMFDNAITPVDMFMISIQPSIRFHFPLRFGRFVTDPFAGVGFELSYHDEIKSTHSSSLGSNISGGLHYYGGVDFAWCINDKLAPVFGVSFNATNDNVYTHNALNVYAGVKFYGKTLF